MVDFRKKLCDVEGTLDVTDLGRVERRSAVNVESADDAATWTGQGAVPPGDEVRPRRWLDAGCPVPACAGVPVVVVLDVSSSCRRRRRVIVVVVVVALVMSRPRGGIIADQRLLLLLTMMFNVSSHHQLLRTQMISRPRVCVRPAYGLCSSASTV